MGELNKVLSEAIKDHQELNNNQIAKIVVKEHPNRFKSWHLDSIRRKISRVRKSLGLQKTETDDDDYPPLDQEPPTEKYSFKQSGNKATAQGLSDKRITSLDELVKFFEIDLNIWKVAKWECSVYESHTRLRHYDTGFKVKTGFARVDDEHKVVPLYRVWALIEENRPLIDLNETKATMMEELKKASLKYPKIVYPKPKKKPALLEISIFDLHFGKLTWDEETGQNYDIKIAKELFLSCLAQLLEQSRNYEVERILFPIGNDFFNVDNKENTTTAGTPQDEDTRWKKTFTRGRQLIVEAIDTLRQIAPVDVIVVPGNHDAERSFYLGDAIECWYHSCPDVTVNNTAKVRKYYQYGNCLIGFTHGRDEKTFELPMIMATEASTMWAHTKFREWHLGEIHHKKEIKWISTEEFKGTTVRFLRSITSTDAWHFQQGYVNNLRAGEGFVWDKDNGLVCQFTASI